MSIKYIKIFFIIFINLNKIKFMVLGHFYSYFLFYFVNITELTPIKTRIVPETETISTFYPYLKIPIEYPITVDTKDVIIVIPIYSEIFKLKVKRI